MALRNFLSRGSASTRAAATKNDTVDTPVPAPAPRDRRLVSGERVLCRCSLELPKHDPFANYRTRREGFIVINVRGGSLYLPHQLNESAVAKTFPSGNPSQIKEFTLYPDAGEPIFVGTLQVRYLKTKAGQRLNGLVLRFVGLSEKQLDTLNELGSRFPIVEGDEEKAIPLETLHRL